MAHKAAFWGLIPVVLIPPKLLKLMPVAADVSRNSSWARPCSDEGFDSQDTVDRGARVGGAGVHGHAFMDRYENTPGPVETSPARWPQGTSLPLSPTHLTVVVFVHPQCPCTTATLTELEKLLARKASRIETTLVAVIPRSQVDRWSRSALLKNAANIPRLRLYLDIGGAEAHRFGALTSGYSLAYSPSGNLRFAGGLTGARGEAGSNFGIEALAELAEFHDLPQDRTPVFGCELSGAPARN